MLLYIYTLNRYLYIYIQCIYVYIYIYTVYIYSVYIHIYTVYIHICAEPRIVGIKTIPKMVGLLLRFPHSME